MARQLFVSLALIVIVGALPQGQSGPREDQYAKARGFAIDVQADGQDDVGWRHMVDAMVTITHSAAAPLAKPQSLPETVLKFKMRDANNNDASIELGPCRGNPVHTCLYLTTVGLSKPWTDWVKGSLRPNPLLEYRDVLLKISQVDGAVRTFNLMRALPTSFRYVDVAAEGNAGVHIVWMLEVRVNRVEMA